MTRQHDGVTMQQGLYAWGTAHLPALVEVLRTLPGRTAVHVGELADGSKIPLVITHCGEHIHVDVSFDAPYGLVVMGVVQGTVLAQAIDEVGGVSTETIATAGRRVFERIAPIHPELAASEGKMVKALQGLVQSDGKVPPTAVEPSSDPTLN